MDKYEYKVKLAQIEKLAAKKDYVTAAKIADGIDWRKVKSVTTLTLIADIYEATGRLEDCYEILNMIYDRSPVGRRIVYRMAEVATKLHDFEEAIELYKEFVRIAPHDSNKYILKYQIYRERGSAVTDQIVILEEFKSHEYDERWAYELACLYEEAGQIDRCVEECDELILWFSEGEYVAKAMELKMKYQDLTASQQEKFEHRYDYMEQEAAVEEIPEEAVQEVPEAADAEETEAAPNEEVSVPEEADETEEPAEGEDDTPQVSVINTNKFSTINLQEELAKGLQQLFEEESQEEAEEAADTQEFIPVKVVEPVRTTETAETESAAEEIPEEVPAEEVTDAEETSEEVLQEPEAQPAEKVKNEKLSETAELQTEILKYAADPQEPKMETFLVTEEDGQMSLAIGDENVLEKQITGQMTIGEILEAWEEKKRVAREKIEQAGDKKTAVLFETGEITKLLEDFIPKTIKDEEETEEPAESAVEEAVVEEEPAAEEPAAEETAEEVPVTEEMPETEEESAAEGEPQEEEVFEDDLPMDIDLADVLEAALEEPKAEQEAAEAAVTEDAAVSEEEPAAEEDQEENQEEDLVGQNTASMLDAIERALALEIAPAEAGGKRLTEEQEKIFAYFTSVDGMKAQLVTLLSEDSAYAGREDSKEGNLVITGHPGNGKTTLAIDIVKAFQKQRRVKGGKLAKVTGDGMNKKNPEEVVKKLGGGALIIERAGALNAETVEKLSVVMEGSTGGLLVILEDDAKEIAVLFKNHPGFAMKFTRSVDIPIFSNDELVAFGKSYAEEQEYFFDEMAVLALYDCIGVRQTSDHVVNIAEVKGFVDDAIAHAEKKSKKFFVKLSKKRIDEYGNKLLLEEDFEF